MSIETPTFDLAVNSQALEPGCQLLSGQYEIIRYLSSGGFAITYLARDSLNRTVVIKECFPEAFCHRIHQTVRARAETYAADFRSVVRSFIREAHALSQLDHPGVVGVHQVFEDNETAYMALDLVDGKDLLDMIETGDPALTPAQVRGLALALLDAIGHVHSQDLLHRDISPDNILVDREGRPVLIDFGAARQEASRKSRVLTTVLVVKDGYSPQEFYVAGSQQYPSSDLYALAASLTHLICGEAPPDAQTRLAALAQNQPDVLQPLKGRFPAYDDAFLTAIDQAMHIVPAERIQSAAEWAAMIDGTRQDAQTRAQLHEDEALERTVSDLVQAQIDAPNPSGPTRAAKRNTPEVTAPKLPDPKYDAAFLRDLYPDGIEGDGALTKDQLSDDMREMLDGARPSQAPQTGTDGPQVPEAVPGQRGRAHAALPTVISQKEYDAAAKVKRATSRAAKLRRLALIPAVLVVYAALGHTVLGFDDLHRATVGQIIALGQSYGYWGAGVAAGG
ncbi:serine/threonine-protein kinase [Roseobacter sp.]|uniref:serine/threonine-protein kinase n=1 Tax=Roseobacter sp. TaxID=1907202 RepID=UPI0032973854